VLAAFDALSALFADDLRGEARLRRRRRGRDVARPQGGARRHRRRLRPPVAEPSEYAALLRPWRTVFPTPTVDEPDLGPRGDQVKALLSALPRLAVRCHDEQGRRCSTRWSTGPSWPRTTGRGRRERLPGRRADQPPPGLGAGAPHRHRGPAAPVPDLPRPPWRSDRETPRVLELCLDAACALLVADALPDACTDLLADPVLALIPHQRMPDRST
jgi:hypothetical protein